MSESPFESYDKLRAFLECPDLTDKQLEELHQKASRFVSLLVKDYLESVKNNARIHDN